MKLDIKNFATRNFSRMNLKLKKHSPEILVVTGVVGVVVSAVMACKATTKVDSVLETTKENIENVHKCVEKGECVAEVNGELKSVPYTEEDGKKDLTIFYAKAGMEFVKMYAPSVILGAASIACILTSNNMLRQRNVAMAAAYTAVDTGFKEYRGRVIERFGKDLDRELKYNIKSQKIEEKVINKKGEEKTVSKTIEIADPNVNSEYARFYDCGNKGWTDDPEANLMFLRQTQNYANDLLKRQGYLFLNDVYKTLGIRATKAGQVVGWIYDEKNPVGDNFVDFGIYDINKPRNRDFVNGYENVILLDFNVDGPILDLI